MEELLEKHRCVNRGTYFQQWLATFKPETHAEGRRKFALFLTYKLEIFRTYLLFDIILRNDIKSDIYYIWFPINTGRLGQISYIAKSWQILIQKEALDVKYSSKLVSRSFKVMQVKNSKTRSKKFKFRTFLKSIHSTC